MSRRSLAFVALLAVGCTTQKQAAVNDATAGACTVDVVVALIETTLVESS